MRSAFHFCLFLILLAPQLAEATGKKHIPQTMASRNTKQASHNGKNEGHGTPLLEEFQNKAQEIDAMVNKRQLADPVTFSVSGPNYLGGCFEFKF